MYDLIARLLQPFRRRPKCSCTEVPTPNTPTARTTHTTGEQPPLPRLPLRWGM